MVNGVPPAQGPMLLAANHISWLDIVVMLAARPCRFGKADIKHWPLIGAMASASGTLFIERESRRDAMRVVHHMAEQPTGDVLAVFRKAQPATASACAPFRIICFRPPVLRQCGDACGPGNIDEATDHQSGTCYIGDDTLWQSRSAP
jgi:1-acyl-sn-glycerol-3-phosphate acyltransferase